MKSKNTDSHNVKEFEYCGEYVRYYCGICLEENCIFYPCKFVDILLNHIREKHNKQYN